MRAKKLENDVVIWTTKFQNEREVRSMFQPPKADAARAGKAPANRGASRGPLIPVDAVALILTGAAVLMAVVLAIVAGFGR